jgi:transcriptional regulator GlxA family with amidase domain
MHRAAAVLFPQALATSVTLPMEILQAASQMARAGNRGATQVRFLLAGPNRRLITLGSGIVLKPDIAMSDLPALDLLLLPAIWRNPLAALGATSDWQTQLREHAARGTRICSVGTGSYLLAEAGLLDGKAATTHWNYFEQFARRYPAVDLKTRHLITQSDNIYCVGSVNSIADLMVHIVEEWFGHRIARAIENQFSPEIRRSFRAAAYQNEADSSHHDEVVAQVQQWLQANLSSPISLEQLAAQSQLSARTLHRRFKRATGMSPLNYLQSLRIVGAKELLRHSNLTVGDIAWQQGIQDISYFSQLFRRHAGMSPLQYRNAVRGKLFAPEVSDMSGTAPTCASGSA